MGSDFEKLSFDVNTPKSCSLAFVSSQGAFLIYQNSHCKNVTVNERSVYDKDIEIYNLKHDTKRQNVVATFHLIIRYNNCENKMYLNTPYFVFTSNKSCSLNELLMYFKRQSVFNQVLYFKTNGHLSREQYLHAHTCVLENRVLNFDTEKKKLKKIDLFVTIQQMKHKIPDHAQLIGTYIMFFSDNFKEMLLHEPNPNELPQWLIDDMTKWLGKKKCTFENTLEMIRGYRIDYIKKDESKTLSNQWDAGMRTNVDERLKEKMNFIKWYYENLY